MQQDKNENNEAVARVRVLCTYCDNYAVTNRDYGNVCATHYALLNAYTTRCNELEDFTATEYNVTNVEELTLAELRAREVAFHAQEYEDETRARYASFHDFKEDNQQDFSLYEGCVTLILCTLLVLGLIFIATIVFANYLGLY